jgi:hypothetical protein
MLGAVQQTACVMFKRRTAKVWKVKDALFTTYLKVPKCENFHPPDFLFLHHKAQWV